MHCIFVLKLRDASGVHGRDGLEAGVQGGRVKFIYLS